jgi:hypothetical protein
MMRALAGRWPVLTGVFCCCAGSVAGEVGGVPVVVSVMRPTVCGRCSRSRSLCYRSDQLRATNQRVCTNRARSGAYPCSPCLTQPKPFSGSAPYSSSWCSCTPWCLPSCAMPGRPNSRTDPVAGPGCPTRSDARQEPYAGRRPRWLVDDGDARRAGEVEAHLAERLPVDFLRSPRDDRARERRLSAHWASITVPSAPSTWTAWRM